MTTLSNKYLGQLSVEASHTKSGVKIISDAPTDNNGKGSSFSPTDLVASALSQCMITIMGIKANSWGKDLNACESQVTKIMASNPRRIQKIEINFKIAKAGFSEKEQQILENSAKACPVALSLGQDLEQKIEFNWV
jgi:putative redox protein